MLADPLTAHAVDNNSTSNFPTEQTLTEAASKESDLPSCVIFYKEIGAFMHQSYKRLYIPREYRKTLLRWFHGSKFAGHVGISKTVRRLQKVCWWKSLRQDTQEYVRSCPSCLLFRQTKVVPSF
eukprot:GHVP01036965.1.p1 GENE.GHVP01036965.1~~GHVP01036965.1.p1  ORF type:complete len:124 (-),score=8.86 GHVP01036965.1:197-568(-)